MTSNPYQYPTHTVKPRRKAAGMTQMQLAVALGTQLETVRRWDQGRVVQPSYAHQRKLDEILGSAADWLAQQENEQ